MIHPEYQLHIERFVKSTIINAHFYKITKKNLISIQNQALAKDVQRKQNRNVIQKKKVATVG